PDAEQNVQSDWNQTTVTADDFILNKPTTITGAQAAAIAANTAKVTNATHTGDVTGDVALTISDDAVTLDKLADGTVDGQLMRWNGTDWELVLQEADDVDLATDIDVDNDGTDETNVQDALAAFAALPQIYATGKVNANGTTAAIYNAAITKITTNNGSGGPEGDYQVTFSTALSNANYIIQLTIPDCGGDCPGNSGADYDDPGITYYDQQTTGFKVNIGDSDNGTTQKDDIDLDFMFTVIIIPN
ncbi:hypothetical protein, partial [Maribacter sp. 2304DJ31-5]|uniref:hypothetical protein n=1 Tax=Maribacter sp. 2304DJ31-5 TaxID=3386273 RepID=UPI0039BCBA79